MKLLKKLLLWFAAVTVLAVAIISGWMYIPYPAQSDAIAQALHSDEQVQVTDGKYLVFSPRDNTATRGLIFYPGGKTPPETFAPLLRQFAAAGLLVVAVPMPLNTAFLAVEEASAVIASFPDVTLWYLAGHSLGGVAAAMYVAGNPGTLAGLILWASYPASDISDLPLATLSIYARNDLSTTPADISQHQSWLPADSTLVEIEGNHWQFGHYSEEQNQQSLNISRQQQQEKVLSASLEFMGRAAQATP